MSARYISYKLFRERNVSTAKLLRKLLLQPVASKFFFQSGGLTILEKHLFSLFIFGQTHHSEFRKGEGGWAPCAGIQGIDIPALCKAYCGHPPFLAMLQAATLNVEWCSPVTSLHNRPAGLQRIGTQPRTSSFYSKDHS